MTSNYATSLFTGFVDVRAFKIVSTLSFPLRTVMGLTLILTILFRQHIDGRFPLPLITIKMMGVFKNLYVEPGMCINVERAVELDAQRDAQLLFSPDVYRQPVLTEKLAESQYRRSTYVSTGARVSGLPRLEIIDETEIADGKIV